MRRMIFTVNDTGGVGKSTVTRALAETAPAATIFEIEVGRRLLELGDRVQHFEARATLADINATAGRAARAELYPVIDAIAAIKGPGISDIGANTGATVIATLSNNALAFAEIGIELGFVIVATSDPSSIANARAHAAAISGFAAAKFLVQNKIERGSTSPKLVGLGRDFVTTHLEDAALREEGKAILDAVGLKGIADISGPKLREKYGFGVGGELHLELTRLRYEAMRAVEPAAIWLTGGSDE